MTRNQLTVETHCISVMALVHIAGKLKFGAEKTGKKGKKRI
jgi:hypothetical protein